VSFFDAVETGVREFGAGGVSVSDYRLALAETTRSELGIEANRLGSPYAPLTVSELAGGTFLIRWSDGKISHGSLSRAPEAQLEEVLASAFEGRYEDPEDENFPEASEVPDVDLFSSETAAVAEGRSPESLPRILAALDAVKEEHGAKLLDASADAVRVSRRVVSSAGFRADSESSRTSFSLALDSLVWDGHASREVFTPEEVALRARRTAEDYRSLKTTCEETVSGRTSVLLHPRVAESFLRTFLFSNLDGGAVANGRARFTVDDFRAGKRVFREDFRLSAHPHEPMGIGSFRCTDEGVPSRELDFVSDGRLRTPALGLKYARRLDMEPAPAPGAIDGYRLSLSGAQSMEETVAAHGKLVLVHSVMGLHTQDAVRAEYSLLAPQCTLHVDGADRGRLSVTLNGSFFDDLSGEELAFVPFPGFACPGLLLACDLS